MILLDTHVFLWMNLSSKKLPGRIRRALDKEEKLSVSPISFWEIAMLHSHNRIIVPKPILEWLREAISAPSLIVLPITPEIAVRSGNLSMHGDPADRLITATAIEHGCKLATVDDKLIDLPIVKTVS